MEFPRLKDNFKKFFPTMVERRDTTSILGVLLLGQRFNYKKFFYLKVIGLLLGAILLLVLVKFFGIELGL